MSVEDRSEPACSPAAASWPSADADVARVVDVMQVLARHDESSDASRGAVTRSQAALLEAVGRNLPVMPAEVVQEALAVVAAVNRATGHRA